MYWDDELTKDQVVSLGFVDDDNKVPIPYYVGDKNLYYCAYGHEYKDDKSFHFIKSKYTYIIPDCFSHTGDGGYPTFWKCDKCNAILETVDL
jgi:hypothetical protein